MRIDLVFEPGWARVTELPAHNLAVAEDTHSFAGPDGMMWRVGYAALDDSGRFLRSDEHAVGGGKCLAFNVAGTSHRRDAVQHPSFAPGSAVLLRPEPSNPHDANAVGIWDRSGTVKAGFVPRALSPKVAASFRGGLPLGGAVLSEFRLHSRSGQRVGLQVVVAPASALRLDVRRSWWSTAAALTDASAVARVADAALMTLFRVSGATGVLKIASDLEPEQFAQILRSRGVALVAGP